MTEKIYKPKTCHECHVVKDEKGKLTCLVCHPRKTAVTLEEIKQMYNKCPLQWD